jgi:tetratricopeptide (TPR) repeat protein
MAMPAGLTSSIDAARKVVFAITAASTAIGGSAVAYKVATTDPVVLEAIAVPDSLEEQGFTAEIATQRILDELATFNNSTVSAKDRTSFGDKRLDLTNMESSTTGFDLKQAIGMARELFGTPVHRISGEITEHKAGERTLYHIRLRQTPEHIRLVEFEASGEPDQLFQQTALKLLEAVDPHIAAAVHYVRFHDKANALRMIDVVLTNDTPADDKYSLNLRAQIAMAENRLDDALADVERAMALDPKFPSAYANAAAAHRLRKDTGKAKEAAGKAIALGPELPYGYGELGRVLRDLKDNEGALALFAKSIEKSRQYAPGYNQAGLTLLDMGRDGEAQAILARGVAASPDNAHLRWNLGRTLVRLGRPAEGVAHLEKAVALDGGSPDFLMSLAEAYSAEGRAKDARPLVARLKGLASGHHLSGTPALEKRVGEFLERHKGA